MHKSKGAAGILFMTIAIALATVISLFSYRYYTAQSARVVKEEGSRNFTLLIQQAMLDRKAAVMRRYSSRAPENLDRRALANYYAFFPESLAQLVTEGYLNLADTGYKLAEGTNAQGNQELQILDRYNRPILYFRSTLARVPFEGNEQRAGCQFEFVRENRSNNIEDDDFDVLVPSVVVVLPGGRFSTTSLTGNEGVARLEGYHAYYRTLTPESRYSDLTSNGHYTRYFDVIENGNRWSVDAIKENLDDERLVVADEILSFDAVDEYISLDQEIKSNIASIADGFVGQWRDIYVRKLTDMAQRAQMSPEQYLVVASTRAAATEGWPAMLESLCREVNDEVFGRPLTEFIIGYRQYHNGFDIQQAAEGRLILNNFRADDEQRSIIRTELDFQDEPRNERPFSRRFLTDTMVYDQRWLSAQRLSALSEDHYPGVTLNFKCACRLQTEQAVACEDLSQHFLDERDVFVREMFLEVSHNYSASECPWFDNNL